jgi:hypothetical protein
MAYSKIGLITIITANKFIFPFNYEIQSTHSIANFEITNNNITDHQCEIEFNIRESLINISSIFRTTMIMTIILILLFFYKFNI